MAKAVGTFLWHSGNFETVSVFYLYCDIYYSYIMLLQCKDEKMVKQFDYTIGRGANVSKQDVRSYLVWTR